MSVYNRYLLETVKVNNDELKIDFKNGIDERLEI